MTTDVWAGEPCITHWEDSFPKGERPRRCYRRGLHYASCENPDECRGCVPRSAVDGLLCPVCAAQIRDAIPRVANLIAHLRSIEKIGQPLGERVATSMERSILFPDTWAAADLLLGALGARPFKSTDTIDDAIRIAHTHQARWEANLDEYINTEHGAVQAVTLIGRMKTALKRWPESEAEWRKVPYVACPTCHKVSLFRRAPLRYKDDLLLLCATPGCGYERDWFEWSETYAPIFTAIEKQRKTEERRARRAAKTEDPCPHTDEDNAHTPCYACDGEQCPDRGHCDSDAHHEWQRDPNED